MNEPAVKHPPVGADPLLSVMLASVPRATMKLLHTEGADGGGAPRSGAVKLLLITAAAFPHQASVYVQAAKVGVQRMDLDEGITLAKLFFFSHNLTSSWHATFPSVLPRKHRRKSDFVI